MQRIAALKGKHVESVLIIASVTLAMDKGSRRKSFLA